jgi:glucose-6-phosphate 1-dehydrogenase
MIKDPICGMNVDPKSAPSATRDGVTHRFCSEQCREQFLASTTSEIQADECTIVIFGASGDLTKRKLIPALYNLTASGLLSGKTRIIGVARRPWSEEEFRTILRDALGAFGTSETNPTLWSDLECRIQYCEGSFDEPETYSKLRSMLARDGSGDPSAGNVLFYLSVQPESFAAITDKLHTNGLTNEIGGTWRRIVIEKPFGHDLSSARTLNDSLVGKLTERQIFWVDHYLGKETAQNILVFRLGNTMIEPVWNRNYIDRIEITAAESIGIEGRGAFYENTGALRDMMQSHLLMLLSLIAMEPPFSSAGEAIRNEKVKLLESVRIPTSDDVLNDTIRGQYGPGKIDGVDVPGYRDEPGVSSESRIETFTTTKLWIDNWRWSGVPFYLRTGKRLPRKTTEIVVRFKSPPQSFFGGTDCSPLGPNLLVIHIQPDEGITLQMRAKTPGPMIQTQAVTLDFDYSQFGKNSPTTGYEKILYDCMVGDPTLFHRTDMVEAAWKIAYPILRTWNENPPEDFPNYAAGSWGPDTSMQLSHSDHSQWWTS